MYFSIPISYNFRRRYSIGGAISKDEVIKKAMIQAQQYCVAHGAKFGVITNGEQFIIFEAIHNGDLWEKGNCVVFYSQDDIQRHFNEFWNILSKDAVEKNSLLEIVSKDVVEMTFSRPIDDVVVRNVKQPRNNLYRYFTPIIDFAFQEITAPEKIDMLTSCYVYQQEFDEIDKLLKSEFSLDVAKIYSDAEIKKIIQSRSTSGIFQKDFYKNMEKLRQTYGEPILLLLLGGIGSGKTTFIHRFYNIILKEIDKKQKILWFYVDWKLGPTDVNEIRPYILRCILREFYGKYGPIADRLKNEFKIEDVTVDLDSIRQLFAILKALGYVLSLVVDNVDQHKSASPTFHENVFIETNSLTSELRIITIMTLREESYYRSSTTGAFDAYYIQKYLIKPPDFVKLILHRLEYVVNKLDLPEDQLKELLKTNIDFGNNIDAIKDFLKVVQSSFNRPRAEISEFMAATSGGNMRRTLELFGNFLMSGNTKINEMLAIYRKTGKYTIAQHQLLKSIMLGDYKYYSEEPSYIMNLFDFNMDYSNDHFLNLKILKYAEEHLTNITEIGRAYIEINQLMKEAFNILISPKAIEDALLRLAKRDLIVFDTKSRESVQNADYFRMTECGSYFLNVLSKNFVYLDSVWMDTPIADIDLVRELRQMINYNSLDARFERTDKFLNYLLAMEEEEKKRHPEHQSSPLGRFSFARSLISGFDREKQAIMQSFWRKYASLDIF
jgi:DNA-binding PadR family transcriptional regulator